MDYFYKVEWNGVLLKYKKVGHDDNGIPKWTSKSMMDCDQFSEWKIKEVDFDTWLGCCTMSEDKAMSLGNVFPEHFFEEACECSKELWDTIVAPNALYYVARYFDNVFDDWVSEPMSKKHAHDKCQAMKKGSRYLTSYEIKKVEDKGGKE